MNDLQNKIGGGLNKLQDSLQQGKQKFQIAQELNQFKKVIQDAGMKRAELILQLGEEVYQKLRSGEVHEPKLIDIAQSIMSLDHQIYQSQRSIEDLSQNTESGFTCKGCGASVTSLDKFCGACGSPIVREEVREDVEKIACSACEESIPASANFCSCCGNKVS